MFNKISLAIQLLRNMGLKYILYRVYYEIKKKSGFLKQDFPICPQIIKHIDLKAWRESGDFYIKSREEFASIHYKYDVNYNRNQDQFNGDYIFFSNIKYALGLDYDWLTNPDTGYKYSNSIHWSDINDFDSKTGDIKYVWEKSRFSYIYLTIRNDMKYKTDSSEFIFNEIKSWIDSNPINQGPNYKCSQEISLRVLNWYYALQFYKNSKFLTEDLFTQIMHVIYWQIKHVYSNINFSRIAVRNNHAITETLTLYLAGLLFPYFPDSEKWKNKGKRWFEQEIKYQIYNDGTFLQFSMNYHRVIIQLFNLALTVSSHYNQKFSNFVYDRAYKSLNFLYQCQDLKSGCLPNYGANDGALFFPLSDCNYRDYRPSLNTLHFLLTSEMLYSDVSTHEELILLNVAKSESKFDVIEKKVGWSKFDEGGYYVLNEPDTITFIRCGNHKDRPSQADNLHLDIWYKSNNILFDSGTYKYNTDKDKIDYFFGTESHNTVMLNNHSQMLKGSRFVWFYWTQKNKVKVWEDEDGYKFDGSIKVFSFLNKNILHTRKIEKSKGFCTWKISDEIKFKSKEYKMRQLWHYDEKTLNENNFHTNAEVKTNLNGFRSSFYGSYETCQYMSFESKNNSITTTIKL